MIPFTQKLLMEWAGPSVYRDAQALLERGAVQVVSFEPPFIRGTLSYGNRSLDSRSRICEDGTCESFCPCRDNQERGIICAHVIALGLALIRKANDPERQRKKVEEARKAARLAHVDEQAYVRRTTKPVPGATPARLVLRLLPDWDDRMQSEGVPITVLFEHDGILELVDQVSRNKLYLLPPKEEALLYVLEDISEGPVKSLMHLGKGDFINLLELMQGMPMRIEGVAEPVMINATPMNSTLRVDLDHENGELLIDVRTELPFLKSGEFPLYIVAGRKGWTYGAGHLWPLEKVLPAPLQLIYDHPLTIERPAIPRFLSTELPVVAQHMAVETDITIDLFAIEPAQPRFRLMVRGSAASLAATLQAEYDDVTVIAGKQDANGHFAHPDPADLLRFTVRNIEAEKKALARLSETGLRGTLGDELSPVVGCREVLNVMARDFPALRREGWHVVVEGKAEDLWNSASFVTPVVRVADGGANGWFEVDFDYDDGQGGSLAPSDVQRALLKGEYYIERDGRTILLDGTAIEAMRDIFSDCAAGEGKRPGSFRLSDIYASYVKSSLDALDGVDVEAAPAWQTAARRQNRELAVEPVTIPDALSAILRPYQRDGVNWLRFLETHRFGGILADEMGLGKTLQALTWLQLSRVHDPAQRKPALIVCPTSLVENWAEESHRFTPQLSVMTIQGADRHLKWVDMPKADLVVTSYALLRRDIEQYSPLEFSVVVLDEAQHIKNRSTQNAIVVKKLKSAHRLVLTGTPIENGVSDLWSIMDFLMSGYLGSHESFRERYEQPISRGEREGELAQARLRRKLQPFLLRRMKKDVATDLPPKIARIAHCTLTSDQQTVYRELLEMSQRKILSMVEEQGFQKSRMEILKTLLRLRQVCCHLDLLKNADLQSKQPSAKMDLFLELLDEALDGGHRVLVFSQFTTMLGILRQELERRQIQYCYLDGATPERLKMVHEFNRNRSIPVFLISLKAGGTGLNLTGADMVIHYDPWWNPAVEDQATDRAYRIGQKRTVYSVKLITRGTVEEKVLAMQQRKKSIIDATLSSDEQVMEKLNWEDVQELLNL